MPVPDLAIPLLPIHPRDLGVPCLVCIEYLHTDQWETKQRNWGRGGAQ